MEEMTDQQIRELAERYGWWGVGAWWAQAIPRFRAMLKEYAAQKAKYADHDIDCSIHIGYGLCNCGVNLRRRE